MKVAYNNIVRGLFSIDRFSSITEACAELSLPTFYDIYRGSMNSLFRRVLNSPNNIVQECFLRRASALLTFFRSFTYL